MKQILTTKERWRYSHWCIWPGIFWPISPWFLVAILLTGLVCSLTFDSALSFFYTLSLNGGWYKNAVLYIAGVVYVFLCGLIAYGTVYMGILLHYFFFDKDKRTQAHFKRYHICKNCTCHGCDKKNDCPAAPRYK